MTQFWSTTHLSEINHSDPSHVLPFFTIQGVAKSSQRTHVGLGLATGLEVSTGGEATGLSVAGGVEQEVLQAPGHASFAVTPLLFLKEQRVSGFKAT